MKAIVDTEVCCGTGLCAQLCPAVFEICDDKATVKVPVVPKASEEACKDAANGCPTAAITIEN